MADKKFEIAGDVSIVSTGVKSIHKEEFEKAVDSISTVDAGTGVTLSDMYDRYSKLLYVVDVSGSMNDGLLSEDSVNEYIWTPEIIQQYRDWLNANPSELTEEVEEWDDDAQTEVLMERKIDVDSLTDDQLKVAIVMEGLEAKSGIYLQHNYKSRKKSRSKLMAVKDAAKDFVRQRFQKFADARVGVFEFDDHPRLLCAPGAIEAEVLSAIERMHIAGGTDIYRAVNTAVNDCKKRPSEVNVHHIVLVSDGCDHGATQVKDLLPKMKEVGMVFDFIFIQGPSGFDSAPENVISVLRGVCEATGGEFVTVKTEKDFEQKFLAASNRPMLPPARS